MSSLFIHDWKTERIPLPHSDLDMLSSILNSWANLVKRRPNYVEVVVHTLTQWTPVKFEGSSASVIRSAEKGIRILLVHISR